MFAASFLWSAEVGIRDTSRLLVRLRPGCRSFLIMVVTVISVVVLSYVLIFAVSCLPQEPLRQHIKKAQVEGYFENNYPKPAYLSILNKRLDMYTECFGLGIAVTMRPEPSTLLSMPAFGECSGLSRAADANFEAPPQPYMRYTHGYQLFLKPLYTFFSFDTVRLLTFCVTSCLLALLFATLRSSLNTAYAVVVVLSFFITKSSSVFLLVTHASQFWLVLIGAVLSVRFRKRASPFFMFGILGACDAVFSFLNMGSLSLGLPMLCYALTRWNDGMAPEEIVAALFWGGVGWSVGFVIPWLMKWSALTLALHPTKEQLFGATLDAYPTRSLQMICTAMYNNLSALHWRLGLALSALLLIRRLLRRQPVPSGLRVILLPALAPVVWICILPGQSGILHAFFINVILWPAIAALFLVLLAMRRPWQEEERACLV